eukprot:356411-Chlamydomonas_euryale.AAC.1
MPCVCCAMRAPAGLAQARTGRVVMSAAYCDSAPFARSAMSHNVSATRSEQPAAATSSPTVSCFSASIDVTARLSGTSSSTCRKGGQGQGVNAPYPADEQL